MDDFVRQYLSLFRLTLACNESDLQAVHRLRYDVYVNDRHWEPENSAQLEKDEYDERSKHILMRFIPTGEALGTARLILPLNESLHKSYPIQDVCFHSNFLNRHWIRKHPEFSRFAISKKVRDRSLAWATELFPKSKLSYLFGRALSFGLIALMTQYIRSNNFDGSCAVLEPSLIRLLIRNGLSVHLLGKPVEYHGVRQACYFKATDLDELLANQGSDLAKLILYFCDSQESSYEKTMV